MTPSGCSSTINTLYKFSHFLEGFSISNVLHYFSHTCIHPLHTGQSRHGYGVLRPSTPTSCTTSATHRLSGLVIGGRGAQTARTRPPRAQRSCPFCVLRQSYPSRSGPELIHASVASTPTSTAQASSVGLSPPSALRPSNLPIAG